MNKFLIICAFICLTGLASGNVLRKIRDTELETKSAEDSTEAEIMGMLLAAGIMVPAACARVSEDGESFKALGEGFEKFVECVEKVVDFDDVKNKTENLTTDDDEDFKEIFKEACTVLPQLYTCVEGFSPAIDGCLKSDEIQFKNSIMKIVKNLGIYACENDSANLIAVLEDDAFECMNSTATKLETCFEDPIEKYGKKAPKSSEEIDELLALSAEDCQELDQIKTCVTTNLDTCSTKAPSKFVNDVYNIVVSEITCGNIINV